MIFCHGVGTKEASAEYTFPKGRILQYLFYGNEDTGYSVIILPEPFFSIDTFTIHAVLVDSLDIIYDV